MPKKLLKAMKQGKWVNRAILVDTLDDRSWPKSIVCGRGSHIISHIVERHNFTLEQRKRTATADNELNILGKLYPLHRPVYRKAKAE
ncbi:hypothetical protein [Pseudomonas sp. PvP001]|uniref:hypothetical protein n=1 Tax=Pseudomonas sp. PvP001 TaxID=3158559 RepID=UPI0033932CA1